MCKNTLSANPIYAEKLETKLGGLITNLPSSLLIGLIFITIFNDYKYLQNTISAISLGMLANSIFLLFFILLIRKFNLVISLVISLTIWFFIALAVVEIEYNCLIINALFYIIVSIIIVFLLKNCSI